MPTKRKLELFDPNKSDSNDTDFEPSNPSTKKPRNQSRKRPTKHRKRSKRTKYQCSDMSVDDEEGSILEESFSGSSGEEEEPELNPTTGRIVRKVTKKAVNYEEDSESDIAEVTVDVNSSDMESKLRKGNKNRQAIKRYESEDKDNELIEENQETEDKKLPMTRTRTRMVTLKIGTPRRVIKTGNLGQTMHLTRNLEPNSVGNPRAEMRNHVKESNEANASLASGEKSINIPELNKGPRSSRGLKGLRQAASTKEEEVRDSSSIDPEAEDTTKSTDRTVLDNPEGHKKQKNTDARNGEKRPQVNINENIQENTAVEEDEEDDFPAKRCRRGLGPAPTVAKEMERKSPKTTLPPRRLTRGLKSKQKSRAEVGSDFEPPDDVSEEGNSLSDTSAKTKSKGLDSESSSGPTGRQTRHSKSKNRTRRQNSPDTADEELDQDEIAEELHDLKEPSRKRRQLRREDSEVLYERAGRARTKVDYTIKPLDQIYAADDDAENAAITSTRRTTGGRNGANQPWERSLFSTFGPFGGGSGPAPIIGGPWGTGVIGGAESDSSEDEAIHKATSVNGTVGMALSSGGAPGLLPGLSQTNNNDATGGLSVTPANLGKVQSQKSLADADPLGVDQNVDFSKIGGLENHIDQLKEMVQMPLLYPELFLKFHVTPPRGVLFHGPPGTGKTLLARALAASVGSHGQKITFYMRKGADALSKWVGEAERQLRLLFEEARNTQPSIIFFDEIDGLAPVRSSKQEQIHASIVSTLLALMDGMDGRGQVIVIGATNRPDNVDPALRRPGRFDREFYFPLPGVDARRSILNIHTLGWGLDESFIWSLAQVTKGYGGADLRALCTEAALNAIQRTFPQIYSSNDKLKIDADKIQVIAKDFMLSVEKIIPSSQRSTSSGATPLPKTIEPLLRDQLKKIEKILDGLIPINKKTTALQEAMYEQYEDDDHGFGREKMQREFENSRVFRPRLLIQGDPGMGQSYIGGAILNHFEGIHVQSFDLATIYSDSNRSPEAALVQLFSEVKRHKPSVIYIPSVDIWYQTLSDASITTFLGLLRAIPPTDPILVLGITHTPSSRTSPRLLRDVFGFSRHNCFNINHPSRSSRQEFFAAIGDYVKKPPSDFPEPLNRKRRKLEVLELAPPPVIRAPTRDEIRSQKKKDHQLLNLLKVAIQPIMDQIQKKYKKFRTPVIPHSLIRYIFDENDPNFVRSDISGMRPYEIDKDKDGVVGLREVASGKFFYNLETTTIEERLSNGFYARPKDFLLDIRSLAKDAKRIGDKERTLKAQELLTNVEVDIALIEQNPTFADCENLYLRQLKRFKEKEEKTKKRLAEENKMPSSLTTGTSGPEQISEKQTELPPNGNPNSAGTNVASASLVNGHINSIGVSAICNISQDVTMGGTDQDLMQSMPPPIEGHMVNHAPPSSVPRRPLIQLSQRSAVLKETLHDSPSQDALALHASPISHSGRKGLDSWGIHGLNGLLTNITSSPADKPTQDSDIPDTQRNTQIDGGEDWISSQALPSRGTQYSSQTPSFGSQLSSETPVVSGFNSIAAPTIAISKSHPTGMANLLNDSSIEPVSSLSSSSSLQPRDMKIDYSYIDIALKGFVDRASECSIEELEQINRELMNGLWQMRGEWNRNKVMNRLVSIFNETIRDIEEMHTILSLSQDDIHSN